ncbi:MAG: ubiquinone biosynthesis regulatory protein kinase UbiB [Gammaproteobacteria bacterium]|nr:ubiquinone biosynthesis regulatory protein kinase UbiB [Gammaproteobacteria bacterium]
MSRRLAGITRILVRHGLDEYVVHLHLLRPYRFVLRLLPWRWFRRDTRPRAVRLREALEDLGPIFVKFGQMVSTRPDLLPDDIASELARLQDQARPFTGSTAVDIVEAAYGEPLDAHFSRFERDPLASASVAQVHLAELHDGTEVAVKVLRPGIESVIQRDLALLYRLAQLALRYWEPARRLRPVEVIDQFARHLEDELDLRREAANASQLRTNSQDTDLTYVPKVYWDLTRRNVMVMERIHGIPIADVEAIRAAGVDMKRLAHNGVEIFFTQAFRDGFFHADMHPGNIFVSPEGQYRAVDFGIMGTLNEVDQQYLAENLLAFFNRDYRAVAAAHLHAGWVPVGTRLNEFEAAVRTVCEPIFARPIAEISFGRLLIHLFQTARRFDMEVQPQLVLLQKTLLNIEGLGRRLYPELDLWETAKPFLERWMRERHGPKAFRESLRQQAPLWWRVVPELPNLVHTVLSKASRDQLSVEWRNDDIRKLREEVRRGQQRSFVGLVGATLLLGAVLVSALDGYSPLMAGRVPVFSWLLGGAGVMLLLAAWPRD